MSHSTSSSEEILENLLHGEFEVAGDGREWLEKRQEALRAAGFDSKVGYIIFAGRTREGTFGVQFNVGGQGWSSRWPEWAYEPARDSLLHGKQVWVIYEGDMPFGANLRQVLVLPYRA